VSYFLFLVFNILLILLIFSNLLPLNILLNVLISLI